MATLDIRRGPGVLDRVRRADARRATRRRGPAHVRTPGEDVVAPDPLNVERATRRARGRVRRYASANGCTRLATFTYAVGTADRRQVVRDWHVFARELAAVHPGVAWLRVLELHPSGHGFHVHAALSGYVSKRLLGRLWGHGFVDVRKVRTRKGGREDARAAARYLAKYIAKEAVAGPGEHRYEVRQGFQPSEVRIRAWSRAEAVTEAIRAMGGEVPSYQWESEGTAEWTGPPVAFLGW